MRRPTDASPPFSSDNFVCTACPNDLASVYDAAALPDGFEKTPWREVLAARAVLLDVPDETVAPIDVLDAIDGAEFELAAQPQRGEPFEGWVAVDLKSKRRLEWDAGDTVHEVTNGEQTFVAFALLRGTDPSTLAELEFPEGYSYRERVLTEPFELDAHGQPRVLLRIDAQHLWQRTQPWQ